MNEGRGSILRDVKRVPAEVSERCASLTTPTFLFQTPTRCPVTLQTWDCAALFRCCRYTEYPTRSRPPAPAASFRAAIGVSLSSDRDRERHAREASSHWDDRIGTIELASQSFRNYCA